MRLVQLQRIACLLYVICWKFPWPDLLSTAAHEMLGWLMLEGIQGSAVLSDLTRSPELHALQS